MSVLASDALKTFKHQSDLLTRMEVIQIGFFEGWKDWNWAVQAAVKKSNKGIKSGFGSHFGYPKQKTETAIIKIDDVSVTKIAFEKNNNSA